ENALLSGARRTAAVIALRDTELMRFSKSAFDHLAREFPSAMLNIARLTVARLERSMRLETPRVSSRTFAVIGNNAGVDAREFASNLSRELAPLGRTEVFTRDTASQHTSVWFNEIEARRDFVLYVADPSSLAWTRQCVAQADTLILLADAREDPGPWPGLDTMGAVNPIARNAELVLLQRRIIRPGTAKRWLEHFPVAHHHHVRSREDIGRLARLITGNAIGLVLSGGGARGFAHIGVIKAIREAGIPIDHCGGTSVGSIMASGVAAGWGTSMLINRHRRNFVDQNPLGDFTLPLISLASGRRVTRLLRREVGDVDIEDLPLPFFCVSTNLTQGETNVHRSGPLWHALRASVAIPGVLPPVFHDKQILVDGGVLNNLPVDVMREFGRGRIIGVDVGSEHSLVACDDVDETSVFGRLQLIREKRAPNILQLLLRAGSLSSRLATATNREQSSILLTPPLDGIDVLDWKAFDRALEAGYRHTLQRMPEIRAALERDRRGVSV
ncbi:MAG: patatin-like phospholipase family protein, partial [Gammaproteobacteria bacterium]|nr:patatin-like phospholipase family protein [Gammaproteobacteria bacterium]